MTLPAQEHPGGHRKWSKCGLTYKAGWEEGSSQAADHSVRPLAMLAWWHPLLPRSPAVCRRGLHPGSAQGLHDLQTPLAAPAQRMDSTSLFHLKLRRWHSGRGARGPLYNFARQSFKRLTSRPISASSSLSPLLPSLIKMTFFLVTGSMKGETIFHNAQKMPGDSYIHRVPSLHKVSPSIPVREATTSEQNTRMKGRSSPLWVVSRQHVKHTFQG